MIGRELKRILQKPTALVCVIIYIAVLFLGIESDLRAGYETGMLNLFWFTENFGATIFIQTLIFPIVAAGNYFDERKGHYDWLMQMRSGQLRYCLAKIVSAVLGGIILYMVSVLLFFILCVVCVPAIRRGNTIESVELFLGTKESLWYRMASSIGIYVLLGLCVSVFCTNQYVFYAMPFLLTRIGTYMGGVLALDAYIPYGRELLADGGWGICLTRNLAAYAVLGFLYYREMKWRGING